MEILFYDSPLDSSERRKSWISSDTLRESTRKDVAAQPAKRTIQLTERNKSRYALHSPC